VNGGRQVDYGRDSSHALRQHHRHLRSAVKPPRFFTTRLTCFQRPCVSATSRIIPGKTPANFLYMLHSGMMGWCTIMTDTTQWTPEQHRIAREQFEAVQVIAASADSLRQPVSCIGPAGRRAVGMESNMSRRNRFVGYAFRVSRDDFGVRAFVHFERPQSGGGFTKLWTPETSRRSPGPVLGRL